MSNSYYVIEKKINEVWEDWVVFREDNTLDEVVQIFKASEEKDQATDFRIVKRTDKIISENIFTDKKE